MGYQRRVHGDSCPVSTERQQYSSKMKFLALSVILALAVTLSSAVSVEQALHQEWELFKSTHGKSYSESESEFRMRVFLDNRDKVAAHNALFAKGEVTFTLAMNKFGDLLSQEFAALFNGYSSQPRSGAVFMKPENFKAPSSVDWRSEGYVTPVKDQKQCGSCWAFSAVGALEGQHFRKSGELVSLSEQNLVDCSSRYGNAGCNGGLMDSAFEYVVANGGIDTEASYPYEARVSSSPTLQSLTSPCSYAEQLHFPHYSRTKLAVSMLPTLEPPPPVSWMLKQEANQILWPPSHRSDQCPSPSMPLVLHSSCITQVFTMKRDAAVLVWTMVSWLSDTEPMLSGDFWIVKNSWGASWGEGGYIKMARNMGNQCGIATEALPHCINYCNPFNSYKNSV